LFGLKWVFVTHFFVIRERHSLQDLIEKLALKVCEDLGFYLVEVRVRGDKRQPVFEIYADTDKGITLKECEVLTRELKDRIDMHEEISGNYRLNVSSPGLDRPLERNYEFRRNIGQLLNVKIETGDAIVQKTGELKGFDENTLHLEISGNPEKIDRADVKEAKVKTKW
jgi:ribosome maturation factor RimP